jgi:Peptidase family S41
VGDVYLPAELTAGCAYCLDPSSAAVRRAFDGGPARGMPGAAAVAGDLDFLVRLLADACASYPRLLDHPRFRPAEFVVRWRSCDLAGAVRELSELVPNRHLAIERPQTTKGNAPLLAYEWKSHGDTAVIVLRSFRVADQRIRPQLERFATDYDAHACHEELVFDLRGNGGGAMWPIRRWLARARPDGWRSYRTTEILHPIAQSKAWNRTVEWQVRNGTIDTPAAAAERDRLAATWPELARAPRLAEHDGWHPGDETGGPPYAGRVRVLVDERTGSSGELAAFELQRALAATLVGPRTAGAAEYGEVVRYVLPATGLVVAIPTKRMDLGYPVEGVGLRIG